MLELRFLPKYVIADVAADGGSGLVFGYSHHGEYAANLAKGLSLVFQNKVFIVEHEGHSVQHWANGYIV